MKIRERPQERNRYIIWRSIAVIAVIAAAFLLLASCPSQSTVWEPYTISSGDTLDVYKRQVQIGFKKTGAK